MFLSQQIMTFIMLVYILFPRNIYFDKLISKLARNNLVASHSLMNIIVYFYYNFHITKYENGIKQNNNYVFMCMITIET
jgi:hypothetical protein